MARRRRGAGRPGRGGTIGLLLGLLAAACSPARGVAAAGALPPPDGAQLAQSFFDRVGAARRALPLPELRRDPALDELAGKGLRVVEAGVPDPVGVLDHVEATAPLPAGLQYALGFEPLTPGLDDATRALGSRRSGVAFSEPLLAGDPALDGIGWAATGPWSVFVLRSRLLRPGDTAALQAALLDGVLRARPALRADARLTRIAGEIVADGQLGDDDQARFGRAGGVPVTLSQVRNDPNLATVALNTTLGHDGPGTLREPWLSQVAVAVNVTEQGSVMLLVLATGPADAGALSAQIAAAEPKAAELVNRARAEAALPPIRADASLAAKARQLVAESTRRGCFVGLEDACPGPQPRGVDRWYFSQSTWVSAEDAFTWSLAPAEPGDDRLARFGAAAALGPEGTIWLVLLLAR